MAEPLVLERDRECDAIERALTNAGNDQGSVVLVEGPGGIGKSTLLRLAGTQARGRGFTVVAARGSELERDTAGGIVEQIVPRATLNGDVDAVESAQLLSRLRSLLWPGGGVTPAVVLVDDAECADDLSLGFLVHTATRLGDLPLVLMVACQPAAASLAPFRALRHAAEVTLRPRPLSPEAVATLVRDKLAGIADDEVIAACVHLAAGNPFYVAEILGELAEDTHAMASERRTAWRPRNVSRTVIDRLAAVDPLALTLAQALVVLGDGARLAHVAALVRVPIVDAENAADALARAELWTRGEPLAFVHPLVRVVVEAEIGEFRKRRMHRIAAELLLADGASSSRVAKHLLLAPAEPNAATAAVLRRAGGDALAAGDPSAAARLLRRARAELPTDADAGPILIELANAENLAGAASATTTTTEALHHSTEPTDRAYALGALASAAHVRGDLDEAVHLAQQARAELPDGHREIPRLLAIELGAAALHPGLQHVVEAILVPLSDAAVAGELPDDPVLCAHVAARVALEGPPAVVRALADRALAAGPLIDPDPQGLSIGWLGSALYWADDLEFAETWLNTAIDVAAARGAVLAGATARLQRAWTRLQLGQPENAAVDAEQALLAYREGWAASPWSTPMLASAHVALGDLTAAAAALALGEAAGTTTAEYSLLLLSRCEFELASGNPEAALAAALAGGRHIDERFGVDLPRMYEWRRWAATAAHQLGDDVLARELITPALRRLREIGGPARQLGATLVVAGLVGDDPAESEALLVEAVAVLEDSPAAGERARAQLELGRLRRSRGDTTGASTLLFAALELAAGFGALPLESAVRDELRGIGLRPRRAAQSGVAALTASEQRVAALAARGLSTPQIALQLHVTAKTVETHLSHIYRKMSVRTRSELATAYQRHLDR